MLNICEYCVCLYLRFYGRFQKLMMKTVQKRAFRHVDHLRQLQMPIFAFLEQISKVEHLRMLLMPIFAFLEKISKRDYENNGFQKLMMKSPQKRVFRHVEHLRLLHLPLFAFL